MALRMIVVKCSDILGDGSALLNKLPYQTPYEVAKRLIDALFIVAIDEYYLHIFIILKD
jgi:hypothetical protein